MDSTAELVLGYMITTLVLLAVPAWRIFARAGLQPGLSLVIFLPILGPPVAALILALRRWPNLERKA